MSDVGWMFVLVAVIACAGMLPIAIAEVTKVVRRERFHMK